MKRHRLSAAAAVCIITASFCLAREFGPEWTRVRGGPNNVVYKYTRELKVPVVNYGGGSNYTVRLEADEIGIIEQNDNRGFCLECVKYGLFRVWKNPDGTPASHEVRFPGTGRRAVQYSDLNGDGILDSMTDMRGQPSKDYILVDDRFVAVRGPAVVGAAETTSPDFKVQYIFENGKWRVKSRTFDLDGDRFPDALEMFLPGEPVVRIRVGEQWVPVAGSHVSETMRDATSPSGTKYIFEEGKWRAKN